MADGIRRWLAVVMVGLMAVPLGALAGAQANGRSTSSGPDIREGSFFEDFNYSTVNGLTSAGWQDLGGLAVQTTGSSVILDNDGSQSSYLKWTSFPLNIVNYTYETRARWVGRSWGSITMARGMDEGEKSWWALSADGDGGSGQRAHFAEWDVQNSNKDTYFNGWTPALNQWHVAKVVKVMNYFSIYFDGANVCNVSATYDHSINLTGMDLAAGWASTDEIDWVRITWDTAPPNISYKLNLSTNRPIYSPNETVELTSKISATQEGFEETNPKLPTPLGAFGLAWTGAEAYLFGGIPNSGWSNQILRYRPSDGSIDTMAAKMPGTWGCFPALWTGKYAYTFGGYYYPGYPAWQNAITRYDPTTDTSSQITATLPKNAMGCAAAFDGKNAYIFGGKGNGYQYYNDIIKFDIATETITTLPVSLPDPVYDCTAVWADGYIYIFGGENEAGPGFQSLTTVERFDPATQTLTQMTAVLPYGICQASGIAVGSDIYLFGGVTALTNGSGIYYHTILRYNITRNIVEIMQYQHPLALIGTGTFIYNQTIYTVGGIKDDGSCTDSIFKLTSIPYDPFASQTITRQAAKLPTHRGNMGFAWTGDVAYLFGGSQDNPQLPSNQIVKYDPLKDTVAVMSATMPGTWAVMPALWTGRYIYTFGGYYYLGGEQWQNGIVRYDPAADKATLLATTLPRPLMGESAVFDGKDVYLFGGKSVGYQFIDEIVKFNVSTETISTLSAKLPTAHYLSTAVWTGQYAYIFGGENNFGGSQSLDQIVRFDPSTQTVATMSTKLPFTLCAASAIWDGNQILIIGGETELGAVQTLRDDILSYNPQNDTISELPIRYPMPIMTESSFFDGKDTYVLGGWIQQDSYTDAIYKLINQNVNVSFEVDDPANMPYFILTNTTDATGNTSVSFTLPLDAAEGVYNCTASANVPGMNLIAMTSFEVRWPWSPVLRLLPFFTGKYYGPGDLIDFSAYAGYEYPLANGTKDATGVNLSAIVTAPDGSIITTYQKLTDTTGYANMSFILPDIIPNGTFNISVSGIGSENKNLQFNARMPIPIPIFRIADVKVPASVNRGAAFTLNIVIEDTMPTAVNCLLVVQILDSNGVPLRPMIGSLNVTVSPAFMTNMTITIDHKSPPGRYTIQVQLLTGLPKDRGFALDFRNGVLNVN